MGRRPGGCSSGRRRRPSQPGISRTKRKMLKVFAWELFFFGVPPTCTMNGVLSSGFLHSQSLKPAKNI